MRRTQAYLDLCIQSLMRNTSTFSIELLIAPNGLDTAYPQGQCQAVNREAQHASSEWLFIINDDMYLPPGWDVASDWSRSLCWCPNLIEPMEVGSADPFEKCDAHCDISTFDQMAVDRCATEMRQTIQGTENGFNFPIFIHTSLWRTIGGYDTRYDPWGSNSDSDLLAKVVLAGVQPLRNRDCFLYHFSGKAGTFDGSHEAERQANFAYYESKWGFKRHPDIVNGHIDMQRLTYRPWWVGQFAQPLIPSTTIQRNFTWQNPHTPTPDSVIQHVSISQRSVRHV
jgi:hypothetical protein